MTLEVVLLDMLSQRKRSLLGVTDLYTSHGISLCAPVLAGAQNAANEAMLGEVWRRKPPLLEYECFNVHR